MAKSLNSILQAICAQGLGEPLLADGFEATPSKARYPLASVQYHLLTAHRLCIVDVQRDKYWTNDEGKFCINLSINFPAVGDFSGLDVATAVSKTSEFGAWDRLGRLATGSDYWWELKRGWLFSESRVLSRLSSDVREKWVTYGKPWFDRLTDLRSVYDFLVETPGYSPTISFSLAMGEIGEAREQVIDSLCRRATNEQLAQYLDWQLLTSAEVTTLQRLLMQRKDVMQRGLEDLFGRSLPR